MFMRLVVCLFSLAIFVSCSSAPEVKTKRGEPVKPEIKANYLRGVMQTAALGEVMLSSTPTYTHIYKDEMLFLAEDVQASTSHKGKSRNLSANSGSYELVREDNEGKFYEAVGATFNLNDENAFGGLYIPKTKSISPALFWSNGSSRANRDILYWMYLADLSAWPKFDIKVTNERPIIRSGQSDLVSTLTYVGVASGQIKFVYREYINGMARDAFTQEVSLDYEPEKIYAYKTARFLVHSAGASQVSYTIQEPL